MSEISDMYVRAFKDMDLPPLKTVGLVTSGPVSDHDRPPPEVVKLRRLEKKLARARQARDEARRELAAIKEGFSTAAVDYWMRQCSKAKAESESWQRMANAAKAALIPDEVWARLLEKEDA